MGRDTTDLIKTHKGQLRKTYSVFDGSSRLSEFYEAPVNTQNNEACLKTTYTYVGATSVVEKTKEEVGTWLSSYDI